jgi:dihydrofolate reductase
LLLGRRTYDIFASYWPQAEEPVAKPLNDAVKYVASRGKPELTWNESKLIEGDLIQGVKALKQTDGPELQVHGSSDLIQTLLGGGVIDEMRVLTYPVTLGTGKRLFGTGAVPSSFNVTKTAIAPNGVIMAIYEAAGRVELGSFPDNS